jgi:hypothetical protein
MCLRRSLHNSIVIPGNHREVTVSQCHSEAIAEESRLRNHLKMRDASPLLNMTLGSLRGLRDSLESGGNLESMKFESFWISLARE